MLDEISDILARRGVAHDDLRDAHLSLELAALLGRVIFTDEWRAACESCGVEASEHIVDAMVLEGAVTRSDEGWSFADTSLGDALVAHVQEEQTWRSGHLACANALFAAPHRRPGMARRRAVHLIEAGHLGEALEPLLRAEKEAYDNGEYARSLGYLDTRERLLDDLGADAEDPRRAQNDWRRAQVLQVQGDRGAALALVDKSRRLLQRTDWASERGHAALLHGQMLRDEGRFDDARHCFDRAVRHFGASGDDSGLAASRANRGFLELEYGQPQRALEFLRDALRVFEQIGDTFMTSSMWSQMSHAWLMEDNRAEASRCAERARQIAHEAGHSPTEALAWTELGEIARDAGDWAEARSCYEHAAELWEAANDRNLHIVRFNLALVELGAGEYEAAKALLEDVKARFSELGFGPRAPLVNAGLMVCCAAAADWDGFAGYHALASQSAGQVGLGDAELAWMAQLAANLAEDHGHANAQKMARALAGAQPS